jgi:HSP20 family protein
MANVLERNTTKAPARSRDSADANVFSPFALLRDMTNWMDQVFEGDMPARRGQAVWVPAIEVRERDNNITVCADLPGMNENDIKVEVDNGMLVLQGERKREENEEREGLRRSERFYGSFFRAIPLPEKAKLDQAKADFRNGVLEVTIPMEQAQSSRRQIPVSAQQSSKSSEKMSQQAASQRSPQEQQQSK